MLLYLTINIMMFVKKLPMVKLSGIISFGIKGGKDAGAKFIDALQMILRVLIYG